MSFYAVTESFFEKNDFSAILESKCTNIQIIWKFLPKNGENGQKNKISKTTLCHGVKWWEIHKLAKFRGI